MKSIEEMQKELAKPFPYADVEFRLQSAGIKKGDGKPWGMVLCYITARAVQERLDDVFGLTGWSSKMIPVNFPNEQGFLCEIDATINGETISRSDGAPFTAIESFKGGISDAFKRTAVQLGIGRYLYNLKDMWALFHDKGIYSAKIKMDDGKYKYFKWYPPKLPAFAIPVGGKQPEYEKTVFNLDKKDISQPLDDPDTLTDSEKELISSMALLVSEKMDERITELMMSNEANVSNIKDYVSKIIMALYENEYDFNTWTTDNKLKTNLEFCKQYEITIPGIKESK